MYNVIVFIHCYAGMVLKLINLKGISKLLMIKELKIMDKI